MPIRNIFYSDKIFFTAFILFFNIMRLKNKIVIIQFVN